MTSSSATKSLVLVLLAGCAAQIRQFPLAEPMTVDTGDFRAFGPRPPGQWVPFAWNIADQSLFRPISRFLAVDPASEAVNVNAMDEVPDSSWWTNRHRNGLLDPAAMIQGPCSESPAEPVGRWTVTGAKTEGANVGIQITDEEDRVYLIKVDEPQQPGRATAADYLGSVVYWTVGYHVPCNRVVFFTPEDIVIEEGTTVSLGDEEVLLTDEMLAPLFSTAHRMRDGRYRGVASRFLSGSPLGAFRYSGVDADDLNDIVPHEDRRELRGSVLVAAWINHFDARAQNSLRMWIDEDEDGRGHVMHHMIDFGDSLGRYSDGAGLAPRVVGYTTYFNFGHFFGDFFSLGLVPRVWRDLERGPAFDVIGYYNAEHFEVDEWFPAYPNPAFERATERDKAWMARQIARISPDAIAQIVAGAQLERTVVNSELLRILVGRRQKILARYFRELSPLTDPTVVATEARTKLCLQDLALEAEVADPARRYAARAWRATGDDLEPAEVTTEREGSRACVTLPSLGGTESAPRYLVVDIDALDSDDDGPAPVRVHLYDLGEGGFRVVGLERPDDDDPPT